MMVSTISVITYLVTGLFLLLVVVGRFAIYGYGQRIGANEIDFEYRPELAGKRSLYQGLKKAYRVFTVIAGLWIVVLGIQVTAGAQDALLLARQHGNALSASQMLGALGAAIALAGVGVIVVPITLRWDSRPALVLDARPPIKIRTTPSTTRGQSGADFSALTDAVGDMQHEEARPVTRWYNARPEILWVMLVSLGGILACYLALFIAVVPTR